MKVMFVSENEENYGSYTIDIEDITLLYLLIRGIKGFNGYKALIKDDGDKLVVYEYSDYVE